MFCLATLNFFCFILTSRARHTFGILLLCLMSKRIQAKEGIFRASVWAWDEYEKWLEEGSAESGFSLVHEDLREEGGFDPQDEIAKRLRQLPVMGGHAVEKLPYMSNKVETAGP
ncbi:hypothetical protein M5689_011877 [Euphorbia peplus]|nr:hypothetical protein M5689_011877 [Euphorbia peplus]